MTVRVAALVPGPVAPQHVDTALIDYFQSQLEGRYRADEFFGPHDLIGTVSEEFRLIDKLVRSARARPAVVCSGSVLPARRSSAGFARTPVIWAPPRSGGE
ncbi:hypothetical protein ACIA8H_15945 [Streptomyces goshikiensis]|uniref:hypothetical protein n=1 Tax=Streptomyces goshikiensis TaxID=1942 RepID=UPI0037A5E7BB